MDLSFNLLLLMLERQVFLLRRHHNEVVNYLKVTDVGHFEHQARQVHSLEILPMLPEFIEAMGISACITLIASLRRLMQTQLGLVSRTIVNLDHDRGLLLLHNLLTLALALALVD